jgi:hypothetical protein
VSLLDMLKFAAAEYPDTVIGVSLFIHGVQVVAP